MKVVKRRSQSWDQPLSGYLEDCLAKGAHAPGYGARPRGIEDRIMANSQAIGELLALLNAKGLISDSEMLEAVGIGEWEALAIKIVEATE
jgi:hypothetical protein